MIESAEAAEMVRNLLNTQYLAVLATQGEDGPYSNLVAFAAGNDLKYLIFATPRATRKFANLKANPRVSLLVDNRSNRETDFAEASAVTVLGSAAEAAGSERERYLSFYLQRHPHLQDFVTGPTCALIRVSVEKYILVTRFQEVREVYPAS